jgi:hypothetical protein
MQTSSNPSILSESNLSLVRAQLATVGFATVLHWHLYGARHPTPLAFSDFEDFLKYPQDETKPGDAIDVWPFPSNPEDRIVGGKIPNADGSVHEAGAY